MGHLTWDVVRTALSPVTDGLFSEIFTLNYDKNLYWLVNAFEKLSLDNVVEAEIRSELGTQLSRPFGAHFVLSPWRNILLNPRQVHDLPTADDVEIKSNITIGPRAKKPLHLDIPIMITAISNGLSVHQNFKIAIAKAASEVGTSTNTGTSTVIDSERENAKYLIGQYNRAGWLNSPETLKRVDAIEVNVGQGAWGGAITDKICTDIIPEYLKKATHIENEKEVINHSRIPGVNSPDDLVNLLNKLKADYDVPVGIKFAASDFIEEDLKVLAKTDIDFITIDGNAGGTGAAYPTLEDNVGLPTLDALGRAVNWLEDNKLKDKFNIIVSGGLRCTGDFLKALALGATGVNIGSMAIMATLHTQIVKALPEQNPTQMALFYGDLKQKFDIDEGAKSLANFLKSCIIEMKSATQNMGKNAISELNKEDLVTIDKELAEFLRIRYSRSPRK